VLFNPGPVDVTPEIAAAQAKPMLSHRSGAYHELHARTVANAKKLFGSDDAFLFTASGTAGIEACLMSSLREGETVFVPHNGVFGERLRDACALQGARVVEKAFPHHQGISLERIKADLDASNATYLAMVYNDTGSAVCNRLKEIVAYAKSKGMFVFVDGVSAIGGHEFRQEWGVDLCVVGSQKCVGAPPGLALIGTGKGAAERWNSAKMRSRYMSLKSYSEYNAKSETPFTPAVSLVYAMDTALEVLFREGLEARIERHQRAAEYTRTRLSEAGIGLFAEKGFESNTLTALNVSSLDEAKAISGGMREKHGITIAGGLGSEKGKILRIGHMANFRQEDLVRCLDGVIALKKSVSV